MSKFYDRARSTASRLLTKYGTTCTLSHETIVNDPDSSWKSTISVDEYNGLKCAVFDDDGVLFVNHNITGHTRVLMVEPRSDLTDISIGDKVTLSSGEVVSVKKYKQINPDLSGVIMWALLIV